MMAWSRIQIQETLAKGADSATNLQVGELDFPLLDKSIPLGVGYTDLGHFALLLPSEPALKSFQTLRVKYTNDSKLMDVENPTQAIGTSTFEFAFDPQVDSLEVVSMIFYGLLELASSSGSAGQALTRMLPIFERPLSEVVSKETVKGLIGELIFIHAAKDPDLLVQVWHSEPNGRYDFSCFDRRLEVKTTSSAERVHSFTARQLPPVEGVKLDIGSVLLAVTERGDNLKSLVEKISEKLHPDRRLKFFQVLHETLKFPYELAPSPIFDLQTSALSLRIFSADEIPTVELEPGVLDLRWKAKCDMHSPGEDFSLAYVAKFLGDA